jgi:uncharacterized membrane protein YphA (DoxX/SURF4 family)
MKKINIIYWIATGLLLALMLFSGITNALNTPESAQYVTKHLGYPPYFTQYIGIAKILGVIAILIPGYPRIKEWAYAGFTFDLISATYSFIAIGDPVKDWAPMFIFFIILSVSYIYHHKRLRAAGVRDAVS